jgi:NADH:ubiquinone oxidoreductase subunit 6 (subunit J)
MMATFAFLAAAAVTLAGAIGVVLSRETMRLVLSLGGFLLGVAGLYLYYGMPMLAAAQVFLYVGGVLVLFIFAIMALKRGADGKIELARTFDLGVAAVSAALFAALVAGLWDLRYVLADGPLARGGVDAVGTTMLSTYLVQFEIAGGVLLIALVAAVAIAGREGQR